MFKNTMCLFYFNLKTRSHFIEEHVHKSEEPLILFEGKDLVGEDIQKFNFKGDSWNYFVPILDTICSDKLSVKLKSAINSRIKGTYEGIKLVYHDERGLVWHVFVIFSSDLHLT